MTIIEEILKAKSDSSALSGLISRFAPLIKKYAYLLNAEDSHADLQLYFIELILRLDPAKLRSTADSYVLSYLRCSIQNRYIFMSKQNRKNQFVVTISSIAKSNDEYNDLLDGLCPLTQESHPFDNLDLLYRGLTLREARVIIMLYYYGMTTKELAAHFGVSPPAISQTKSKALRKLKTIIENL
jgi:RNA polymerase sigma factor (sigma-70 family)